MLMHDIDMYYEIFHGHHCTISQLGSPAGRWWLTWYTCRAGRVVHFRSLGVSIHIYDSQNIMGYDPTNPYCLPSTFSFYSRLIRSTFKDSLPESWKRRVCTAQWSTSWPIHLQTHSIVGVCIPATYPKKLSCALISHHWVPLQHKLYPNWEVPRISNGFFHLLQLSNLTTSLFLIFLYSHFKVGWVGQP